MVGSAIPQAFAAFVLSAALAAFELPAQNASQEPQPRDPPAIVSIDLLRHPITAKVRQLLFRVMVKMDAGDHETAIQQLRDMLAKYPDSAPYVYNLLGVEYVKTDRFGAAVKSFEQAALLLPHDAMTHYSLGLALVCAGDNNRAAQEVRRALELDPTNAKMQARLNAILQATAPGARDSAQNVNDAQQYR